jgi:hypothetical protein
MPPEPTLAPAMPRPAAAAVAPTIFQGRLMGMMYLLRGLSCVVSARSGAIIGGGDETSLSWR